MSIWWAPLLLLCSLGAAAAEVFAPSDIPLLDNRFRIDHGVQEITFIIKREPATPSVILVQPDGSKLYVGRVKPAEVGWLALPEHDLITVRNPMPGPWQAIGAVDPDNRVRILSDIRLDMVALPTQLYQGEVVKLKAWLLIDGQPARDMHYLADLQMTVRLQSFSDAEAQQLVLDEVLGRYLDDGKGLDEVPGDGVMTAAVSLKDIPGGKYRAMFSTGNQVFTRARYQNVLLYPYPFRYQLITGASGQGPQLSVQIDPDELDPESVVIKGLVTPHHGQSESFNLLATGSTLDLDLSHITSQGAYEVQATLYGTTRLGREVRIALPTKTFNVLPVIVVASPSIDADNAFDADLAAPQAEQSGWGGWVLGAVVAMLTLFAGAGVSWWRWRRKDMAAAPLLSPKAEMAPPVADVDLNMPQ